MEYGKLILGEEIRQSGLATFFEFLNGSGYVFMIVFPLMIKGPNHHFSNAAVGIFYFFAIIFAYLALRWYTRAVFCLFSRTVVSDEDLIVRSITGMNAWSGKTWFPSDTNPVNRCCGCWDATGKN